MGTKPTVTPVVTPTAIPTPTPTITPGGYGNNSGGVQTAPGAPAAPGVPYWWPDGKGGKTALTAQKYLAIITTDINKQKQAYDLMVKAGVLKKGQTKTDSIVTEWSKVGLEASRNGMDVITYLQNRATAFGAAGKSTGASKTTTGKYAIDMQGNKVPTTQLQNQYISIGSDMQNQFIQLTTELGKKPSQASTVWNQAVKDSAAMLDKGIFMSPLQIVQKQISDRTNKPITYTSTDQTAYDPSVQTPLINQQYNKLVGRVASPDEVNSILQEANAQKQTSSTTYVAGGVNRKTSEIQTPEQIAANRLLTSDQYSTARKGVQDMGFLSWLSNAAGGGTSAAGGQANG